MLTRHELSACRVGDCFVPDEVSLEFEGGEVRGKVSLSVADGRGVADCELLEFSVAGVRVRVTGWASAPAESRLALLAAATGGLYADEAAAMIAGTAQLPVLLRLGSGTVADEDVRPGTVLELEHDPSQPVSLIFEGHVVGAGKFVNVEGEIGVQITSLGR